MMFLITLLINELFFSVFIYVSPLKLKVRRMKLSVRQTLTTTS